MKAILCQEPSKIAPSQPSHSACCAFSAGSFASLESSQLARSQQFALVSDVSDISDTQLPHESVREITEDLGLARAVCGNESSLEKLL